MEVLKVTTVYVHNNNQSQTIKCSDGSQGVMRIHNDDVAPHYDFKFYGHAHLGFWLDQDQFHDGEAVVVKGVLDRDDFQLHFVK
jgi:hypothetical protein